ncbi:MAG: D-alanyl-D-alanine carboxypeptidase [Paenibacillaceae bacterium]|jgi:D-alanyl-D-alanine carboxypeptidase (penicillin-binding protein 5/6)|nr:D-alanyl-D-alanine carboxypeptidase [Paenibacillaceae bacterium]
MRNMALKLLLPAAVLAVLLWMQPPGEVRHHARLMIETASRAADGIHGGEATPAADKFDAAAVVLMDLSNGRIVQSVNPDTPLPPASMSKMMTEYLVLDAIKTGELQWGEKIKVSPYAAGVTGSKVSLQAGDMVSVRDLLAAVAVYSANDAAIVLAERLGGSEEKFASMMNDAAKELGLSRKSRFINATGLPRRDMGGKAPSSIKGEQTLTAADTGKLAARLITDHPEILQYTSKSQYRMEYKSMVLDNTNLMVRKEYRSSLHVQGMDGLKTGFTDEAGYCFTGTAVIDGKRYVSVIMGSSGSVKRFEETKKLLVNGRDGGNSASSVITLGL